MNDINANERGRAAYGRGKTRQPMNDARFVKLMYSEVAGSDDVSRTIKAHYITEWKNGWNAAKQESDFWLVGYFYYKALYEEEIIALLNWIHLEISDRIIDLLEERPF